jgi:regulator of protease activity HflC (stomatin/prohibitin superfamily)
MESFMKPVTAVVGGVCAFVLLALCFLSFACVPAGHVGVVTTFGDISDDILESGLHWPVAPWRRIVSMSVQTQQEKERANAPVKGGLSVTLEASILYSLRKESAADMYRRVGKDYAYVIMEPAFRSALRSATAKHAAEDLYSAERSSVEADIEKGVQMLFDKHGLMCERVLLRDMELPPTIKASIERKLAADQDAQQMEFVITKARKEAERKAIEAKGIADAQVIIKKDLDDNYIRYLWVEALKVHSGAVIYVPTGADGLPFFREVHGGKK